MQLWVNNNDLYVYYASVVITLMTSVVILRFWRMNYIVVIPKRVTEKKINVTAADPLENFWYYFANNN